MISCSAARQPALPRSDAIDAKVVALTNFIGPHHCKQMAAWSQRVRDFSVLLSTPMEPNRDWQLEWGKLNVEVQKSFMVTRTWRHQAGFAEDNYVHIPWDTIAQLKRIKPDVILAYEMGIRTLLSTFYRARHPECRVVLIANISEKTEECRGKLRPKLRQYLRRRVDFATYNGPSCKRYLLAQGYREDQLYHSPYCHDADKVYQGPRVFDKPPGQLFFAGSLTERKGIVPFVSKLAQWCQVNPQRHVQFEIAGDGPLRSTLADLETPGNLNLTLSGSLTSPELRSRYARSDATVFPTLADEWGLVVNESLASGTPVLSSIHAQATEGLCRDDENSWVFDPTSQESTLQALDRMFATPPQQLQAMSQAARQSVAHIHPESSADLFAQFVQVALDSRGPSVSASNLL